MIKKKTIVFFNGFYLPHLGGVERYTSNLVRLLKKYYNIIIVTTNMPKTKHYEKVDGIEIYRLPIYKLFSNRYPIIKKNKEYNNIIKKINNLDIDHIICNTRYYQTTLIGVKIAKKRNIDLSIIDHSSSHVSLSNKIIDFFGNIYEDYLTKKILKSKPRFYGVSKRVNEWLKYYKIDASGVFYNSINKENFNKKRVGDVIQLSYVGRIIKEKGVENLAKSFYSMKDKYNLVLTIAGDGAYLDYMKKNYPDIIYTGPLDHDEVMDLLKETDIFVHPSMYPEGLPTSILEAGMMKCAIIATDRGGTTEVITHNKNGLIVEENDIDLSNKLKMLLDNKSKIVDYQEKIYNTICEKFTWESTANKVKEELNKYE